MRTLKLLAVLLGMLLLVGGVLGCDPDSGEPDGDTDAAELRELTMKFGHGADPENPRNKGAEKFAELVASKSDGKMKVEVFHSASLGSDEEMLDQLRTEVAHFAAPGVGTISPLDPELNVLELPFLFESFDQAWSILDGPIGQELGSGLPENGIRIISFWENGFRNITNSKRPINTPEDLSDIKIRVPNWEMSIATFEALGAQVTPLAWPEVYLGLQTGVVHAQENPYSNTWGGKLYEVQKYLSNTRHQYSPLPLIISEPFWNSLNEAEKNIILEAAEEARDYQRQLVIDDDEKLVKALAEEGMEVNDIPDVKPFQDKVQVVYDEYEEELGEVLEKIQKAK